MTCLHILTNKEGEKLKSTKQETFILTSKSNYALEQKPVSKGATFTRKANGHYSLCM